jgi:hypothetical protein
MNKLLPLLLLISCLFISCAKVEENEPDADYRFQVSCSSCTVSITTGNNTQSYYVQGYQSIPLYHSLPIITVALWTDYDTDNTLVRFVGSGYNRTLFDGYLYYNDPAKVIRFNL